MMEEYGTLPAILRFLKTVVLIDLGIFVAVGLICWFGRWRTAHYYGNGLMLTGVGAFAIGIYSITGAWGVVRSFDYQYAGSVDADDPGTRAMREWKGQNRNYATLALLGAVGLVSVGAGVLVQAVFG
jgi:uncharacterized membrane protein YkgB